MGSSAHGHHAHAIHSHGGEFDTAQMGEFLEVEGQLSLGVLQEALRVMSHWIDPANGEPQRVLDLGAGPGVGTAALAEAFPEAEVVAADGSQVMLDRAAARLDRLGLGARTALRRMDLDGDLADLGHADVVLASMSIHHTADEVATLRNIRALLEAAGLLCVLERAEPNSVRLSEDLGRPGMWDRIDAASRMWFDGARERLPGAHNADRYPQMFDAAGLELLEARPLVAVVCPPDDRATQQFVEAQLHRTAVELAAHADPDDLRPLRQLLDDATCSDLWAAGPRVRISRKLFVAKQAHATFA